MKKARANTNDFWDKKLLEVEEKDPNRWRHTGYKKLYIQSDSSSGDSDRSGGGVGGGGGGGAGGGGGGNNFRYNSGSGRTERPPSSNRYGRSRSRSRLRKSPPMSPPMRRRISPRSPSDMGAGRGHPPGMGNERGGRPRSPPEPAMRRKPSRSPLGRRRSPPPQMRRRSPPPPGPSSSIPPNKRGHILPRSKRPPSPPPRNSCRSRSNSSVSSCSDDSCSVCSPKRQRSRSNSLPRGRARGGPGGGGPRSPPPKRSTQYHNGPPQPQTLGGGGGGGGAHMSRMHGRPASPPAPSQRPVDKYRDGKGRRQSPDGSSPDTNVGEGHVKVSRATGRHSPPLEDPRLKNRPPEPPEPTASTSTAAPAKKKKKDKPLRTRIKIEGEKRKKHNSSSDSDDSAGSDSDNSLPTFTATTRLTLSERFGKMAQWSMDRSNMENMRITKDSAGGALKVMIEEGLESPPRRYSYSPAPAGHFPEELATTAPSGMLSWDDVRVRYEYYKSRGYLRDLDLKDYIKWEEWWYKYQEWLKHERYYEYWERQHMQRRRRKKLPITQRLN